MKTDSQLIYEQYTDTASYISRELTPVLEKYLRSVNALESELVSEGFFKTKNELSDEEIQTLFKNAVLTNNGMPIGVMDAAGQWAQKNVAPKIAKLVQPVVNKLESMYQKSGPIRDFDASYESKVSDLKTKYPQLGTALDKLKVVAAKNKGKASLAIGALTAITGIVGMGFFGVPALAIAGIGVILRAVYGLLAGESPAKALGKATLIAAVGKLIGAGVKEGIIDNLFDDVDAVADVGGSGEFDAADSLLNDPKYSSVIAHFQKHGWDMEHIKDSFRDIIDRGEKHGYTPQEIEDTILDVDLHRWDIGGRTGGELFGPRWRAETGLPRQIGFGGGETPESLGLAKDWDRPHWGPGRAGRAVRRGMDISPLERGEMGN